MYIGVHFKTNVLLKDVLDKINTYQWGTYDNSYVIQDLNRNSYTELHFTTTTPSGTNFYQLLKYTGIQIMDGIEFSYI